ncbi:MAG: co-chaperone DjlA [Gammaproteobacteria bacterium]
MNWWGKVIGGGLGWAVGGPIGAMLGAVIGHNFDRGTSRSGGWTEALGADAEQIQTVFFTTSFSVMGHIAKADGRVSEDEIRAARSVMAHMNLNQAQKEAAIRLFGEGKRPGFALDQVMDQFCQVIGRRRELIAMFIEIQIHAALADGRINPAERRILNHIARRIGVSEFELRQIENLIRARTGRASTGAATRPDGLAEAYRVLGVSKSASDDEVKKAYRRLMSRHHPDKLVAKGLPEEMMEMAENKTVEIRAAYDAIKEARGM